MWPGDQAQHLRNNEVVQHSGRLRKVAQNTHQLAVQLGVILPHPVAQGTRGKAITIGGWTIGESTTLPSGYHDELSSLEARSRYLVELLRGPNSTFNDAYS